MSTSSSARTFGFVDVTDLPMVSITRPVTSGDPHVDALRTAAWDEGFEVGRSEGREAGRSEGLAAGRADGFAEGHAEGIATGRAEAEAVALQRLATAIDGLALAAEATSRRDAVALADIEESVVDLAVGLAAAIIEREVRSIDGTTTDAVRRALRLAPERGGMVVRLHPDEVAGLADVADLAPGRDLEVVADPSIRPGGCLVENDTTQVDARVETALARARAVLLGDTDGTGPVAR